MSSPPTVCACGASKDARSKVCRACFELSPDLATEKTCAGCGKTFPAEAFAWRPDGRGGQKRRARCRRCDADYAAKRRAEHPERHNAAKRAWEAKNPERVAVNRLRRAARQLGLDPSEIAAHFAAHTGRCDICERPSNGNRLSIDHDHATGRFRGLLCSECNLGIGKFRDDPDLLRAAACYLEAAGIGPVCGGKGW